MPYCKSCKAKIQWIEMNPSGKKMPLDINPKSVWFYNPDKNRWVSAVGFESHFATCPDADKHRKKEVDDERKNNSESRSG